MSVTVYLSNTDIEVLNGSGNGKGVTVSRACYAQMPEGSFLNGVITDPDGLVQALSAMWTEHKLPRKGIRLVINTSQIAVRVLDMPILSQSKAAAYLEREFEERNGERNRLMGFYVIGKDKKRKLMKVCTEISDVVFIENYVSVFEQAGIELSEINSGIGVSVNLLKKLKFASEVNSVVMLRDGMTVTAIYFVKGEYFYSTTNRTFNSPGSLEFAGELSNTISQIVQFSKSEKVEDPISEIFLSGMTEEDAIHVERSVSVNLSEQMRVHNLTEIKGVSYKNSVDRLDNLFYATAGLMSLSEHQNLLKLYSKGGEGAKDSAKRDKLIKLAIPYVAVTVVMLAITISRTSAYVKKNKELKELEAYNKDPARMLASLEYDEAAAKIMTYSGHVNSLRLLDKSIDSYPLPTASVCEVIRKAGVGLGEVTINGYSAEQGKIDITATFQQVNMVNTFIERLNAEECLYQVNYTGYSETGGSGVWNANLECILSETAGR